eukprot:gnl/TRDRNA2_/TRDRNA2_130191_c0_seq4.p1 gnl/TRDRNA2_/TRDRNA2_130191_c0~~gnl/TRDRNA2_/TRDRNA2_130191_c0_seq4.p1  ORF type:complete len:672 (-),score=59.79 gnl/TRDRNA2_/TRDRNA2_130191_c0_seq4:137-2152(-)
MRWSGQAIKIVVCCSVLGVATASDGIRLERCCTLAADEEAQHACDRQAEPVDSDDSSSLLRLRVPGSIATLQANNSATNGSGNNSATSGNGSNVTSPGNTPATSGNGTRTGPGAALPGKTPAASDDRQVPDAKLPGDLKTASDGRLLRSVVGKQVLLYNPSTGRCLQCQFDASNNDENIVVSRRCSTAATVDTQPILWWDVVMTDPVDGDVAFFCSGQSSSGVIESSSGEQTVVNPPGFYVYVDRVTSKLGLWPYDSKDHLDLRTEGSERVSFKVKAHPAGENSVGFWNKYQNRWVTGTDYDGRCAAGLARGYDELTDRDLEAKFQVFRMWGGKTEVVTIPPPPTLPPPPSPMDTIKDLMNMSKWVERAKNFSQQFRPSTAFNLSQGGFGKFAGKLPLGGKFGGKFPPGGKVGGKFPPGGGFPPNGSFPPGGFPPKLGDFSQVQNICFPGHAQVITQFGVKNLSQIRIGDSLLGFNSATRKNEFTQVRAWLHRVSAAEARYVIIDTALGAVALSPEHLIAVDAPDHYVFAKDVQVGRTLVATNSTAAVTRSSVHAAKGVYAPLTWTSNFYVGLAEPWGRGDTFFLAHNLAMTSTHLAGPLHIFLSIIAFFCPRDTQEFDDGATADFHHPVARFFWSIAGVLFDHMIDVDTHTDAAHPLGMLVSTVAGVADR